MNPTPQGSSRESPEGIADRLHAAAIHLLRTVREADRSAGTSAARLSALSVLVHAGPLSLGDLAAAEHVASPTMSVLARGLEEEGLASRRPDPDDRRGVRLSATAAGRRLLERARRRRIEALVAILGGLTAAERAAVGRGAALVEAALRRSRERGTRRPPRPRGGSRRR